MRRRGFALLIAAVIAVVPLAGLQADTEWRPGPDAVGTDTFDGVVDEPAAGATVAAGGPLTVRGWFVDRAPEGSAAMQDVHVYLGVAGEGGRLLARGEVGQPRSDIARALGNPAWGASGFSAAVPSGNLPAGAQVLGIYVRVAGKGWWFRQVPVTVAGVPTPNPVDARIGGPAPGAGDPPATYGTDPYLTITEPDGEDAITSATSGSVRGYAADRNAQPGQGTGVNRVEVSMDGPRGDPAARSLGSANLGKKWGLLGELGGQFAGAGWDLPWDPHSYPPGNHRLWVYARSSLNGKETLKTIDFRIRPD